MATTDAGRIAVSAAFGFVLLHPAAAEARKLFVPRDVRLVDQASAAAKAAAPADASSAAEEYAKGKALLALANPVEALTAFRRAIAADPGSIDALNGAGVAYDQLGRPDLARQLYEAALAIAPGDPVTMNNLGYSLSVAGNRESARDWLARAAASANPEASASARRSLAMLAAGTGSASQADASVPAAMPVPAASQTARIERTAESEQRLVLATSQSTAPAVIDADLTDAAPQWRAVDDARLLSQLDREEAAETREHPAMLALAALQHAPAPVPHTPRAAETNHLTLPPVPDRVDFARVLGEEATALPQASTIPLVAATDARAAVIARAIPPAQIANREPAISARVRAARVLAASGTEQRPVLSRAALRFESDDPELNRFASRMIAGRSEREQRELDDFAARVRVA